MKNQSNHINFLKIYQTRFDKLLQFHETFLLQFIYWWDAYLDATW